MKSREEIKKNLHLWELRNSGKLPLVVEIPRKKIEGWIEALKWVLTKKSKR